RRRRSASPAGRRDQRWRDRAELSSRLRRARIPFELRRGTGGGSADALRRPGPPGDSRKGDSPHRLQGIAGARDIRRLGRGGEMITAVISVYKVANFPDGGGHFWVYMQYAQALRRLGCEVYWLEQIRPAGDPDRDAHMVGIFLEKMKRFGLERRTLLYSLDRHQKQDAGSFRFFGVTWSEAEAILRRAGPPVHFAHSIHPRL